jgi:hypothetical protein
MKRVAGRARNNDRRKAAAQTWTTFTCLLPSNLSSGLATSTILALNFSPTLFSNKRGTYKQHTSALRLETDMRSASNWKFTPMRLPSFNPRAKFHDEVYALHFPLFGLPVSHHESGTYRKTPLICFFFLTWSRVLVRTSLWQLYGWIHLLEIRYADYSLLVEVQRHSASRCIVWAPRNLSGLDLLSICRLAIEANHLQHMVTYHPSVPPNVLCHKLTAHQSHLPIHLWILRWVLLAKS